MEIEEEQDTTTAQSLLDLAEGLARESVTPGGAASASDDGYGFCSFWGLCSDSCSAGGWSWVCGAGRKRGLQTRPEAELLQAVSSCEESYHACGHVSSIAGPGTRKTTWRMPWTEMAGRHGLIRDARDGDGGGGDGALPQMRPGWRTPSEAKLPRETFSWEAS